MASGDSFVGKSLAKRFFITHSKIGKSAKSNQTVSIGPTIFAYSFWLANEISQIRFLFEFFGAFNFNTTKDLFEKSHWLIKLNTKPLLIHLRQFLLILHLYLIMSVCCKILFAKHFHRKNLLNPLILFNISEFFYEQEVLKFQNSKSCVKRCKFRKLSLRVPYFQFIFFVWQQSRRTESSTLTFKPSICLLTFFRPIWKLRIIRPFRIEVPKIISTEQSGFRELTFFSADSENIKKISEDQFCLRADKVWFSLNQRSSELKQIQKNQLWISAVQR